MPAKSKDELLAVTCKEFERLEAALRKASQKDALAKDDEGTSIKDVVAHRAHWIDLFLGWYRDGMAGKDVFFPAKGYKWNELKRYNADLRAKQKTLQWDKACAMLRDRHAMLITFLEDKSDADLYGGPMQGAYNTWTVGRWAEAAGASHYRSAAKYVRARLKALG